MSGWLLISTPFLFHLIIYLFYLFMINSIGTHRPSRRLQLRRSLQQHLQERNRIVETHRELVGPIALHYSRCSPESLDDLQQVGMLGLIRAAELFDSAQKIPFGAFARPHIRGAILHHLRDLAPSVRLPRRQAELQERLLKLERQWQQQGRTPHAVELQRCLGIDASQWEMLMRQRYLNRAGSLSELNDDTIAQSKALESPERAGVSPIPRRDVAEMLAILEPRQRLVVQQVVLRGQSYRQLARRMDVSPMTVQRLLHRGLDQLRCALEAEIKDEIRPDRGRSVVPAC